MKPGDLVRFYFDGKGSCGETITGLVLKAIVNHKARLQKDNNQAWVSGTILFESVPQPFYLYWDDDWEILS